MNSETIEKSRVVLTIDGNSWNVPRGTTAGEIQDLINRKDEIGPLIHPEGTYRVVMEADGAYCITDLESEMSDPHGLRDEEPDRLTGLTDEEEVSRSLRARGLEGDTRNRWAKQLGDTHTYDAGKLLDIIRPEVETILIIAGHTSPPSQSARVQTCLSEMNMRLSELREIRDHVTDYHLNLRQSFELQRTIHTLEAFQAVHKTITILEGTVI